MVLRLLLLILSFGFPYWYYRSAELRCESRRERARVRLEVSTLQAIVLSTLNSATGKSGSCVSLEPLVRAVASAARLSPHTTRRLLCAAVAPLAAGAQPLLSVSDESAEALSVGISAAFSWRQHDGHRLSFSKCA